MRILFLDDDNHRHITFVTRNRQHDIVQVFNYDAFVTVLDTEDTFDEIWLDHDLAWTPEGDLDANEKTGLDAAKYLASCPSKYPSRVVVHSWNPMGGLCMTNVLCDVGINVLRQPFSY